MIVFPKPDDEQQRSPDGQHQPAEDTLTRDDERLALWLLEQERLKYAGTAGVEW